MLNIDELMRKATPEQRIVLSKLKGLVGEESKLVKEIKMVLDSSRITPHLSIDGYISEPPANDEKVEQVLSNCRSSIPYGTKQRLIDVRGKIKKTVEEATRYGVLVVPYNHLR